MPAREELEKTLADLGRRREEAEAEAGHAAEALVRMAGGVTPPAQLDPAQIRAAADTFADAVERLRMLEGFARELRSLLI